MTFLVGLTSNMVAGQAAKLANVLVPKNRLRLTALMSSHLNSTIIGYHETKNQTF